MSERSAYKSNGPRPIPVGGCVIRETNTSPYPVCGFRVEPGFPVPEGKIAVRWAHNSQLLFEDPDTLVYMPEWDDPTLAHYARQRTREEIAQARK